MRFPGLSVIHDTRETLEAFHFALNLQHPTTLFAPCRFHFAAFFNAWFFVVFAFAQFGEDTRFLAFLFETAQRFIDCFVLIHKNLAQNTFTPFRPSFKCHKPTGFVRARHRAAILANLHPACQ